ncbi:MAG: DsbC family protein [Halioglobus sp.]|nr:DsbC family protein [Halioglobus sp.]
MIFKAIRSTLALTVLALASHGAAAEAVDKAVEEQLRKALTNPAMGLKVESVEATEMPDMYGVKFSNGPMVYATGKGDFFVVGDLHQVTPTGFVNLTERKRDKARSDLLAAVDTGDMIVFPAKGETRGHISVFTDVTCFYCQKLHLEVPELNKRGIEVRYLAYPRAGLASDGYRKLATAWCADNPQDTLTRLKAKEAVAERVCDDNPIASQFQLGQTVGVRGTPAIVSAEGRLIPGYQPADELITNLGL